MQVELVSTTTSDGVTLHGIFLEPREPRTDLTVDAVLMVHGSGGNFYGSPSNPRAARLRELRIPVALFNTRGHDVIAGHSAGHRVGNAFEILDECRMDMSATVGWLAEQGYGRIGVWGSSLGAVKVVYAQAHNQDPRVAAVISLSPLRLSHAYFLESELGADHRRFYDQARALVDAGRPDDIMQVTFPIRHHFTATVYLDRHGGERYNLCVDHTHRVTCPLLILAGTEETHPRILNAARDMYELAKGNLATRLVLVDGGDHGLHNRDEVLFEEVLGWLGAKEPAG